MPMLLMSVFFGLFSLIVIQYSYYGDKINTIRDTASAYSPITHDFNRTEGYMLPSANITNATYSTIYNVGASTNAEDLYSHDAESEHNFIEGALLKTCRTVNILAHTYHCSDPDRTSYNWSFLSGTSGQLSAVLSMSKSSSFSCSNFRNGSYGRYILDKAIPNNFAQSTRLSYSLTGVDGYGTGINPAHTDPCGYAELTLN